MSSNNNRGPLGLNCNDPNNTKDRTHCRGHSSSPGPTGMMQSSDYLTTLTKQTQAQEYLTALRDASQVVQKAVTAKADEVGKRALGSYDAAKWIAHDIADDVVNVSHWVYDFMQGGQSRQVAKDAAEKIVHYVIKRQKMWLHDPVKNLQGDLDNIMALRDSIIRAAGDGAKQFEQEYAQARKTGDELRVVTKWQVYLVTNIVAIIGPSSKIKLIKNQPKRIEKTLALPRQASSAKPTTPKPVVAQQAKPARPSQEPKGVTEAGSGEVVPNGSTLRIGTSETRGSITNLGSNPGVHNSTSFDLYPKGSGFSGVYDFESGRFLAYPSGGTRLSSGGVPNNRVPQIRGHEFVDNGLSEVLGSTSNNRAGFAMIMDNSGSFEVRWNSGVVNLRNPNFNSRTVPESYRQQILDSIMEATGRNAYSGN